MIIKNIKIYTEDKEFREGALRVAEERIAELAFGGRELDAEKDEEVIDGEGAYCFPGMIDLHFHGCMGDDVCDGTREALETIARYEASVGVTAICPATMTLPVKDLEQVLENAASFAEDQKRNPENHAGEADLVGINMEGPFISVAKRGAQNEAHIIPCDVDVYRGFQKAANGLVKFIGIAPEMKDPSEFIAAVKDEVTVSLAHTNADYDTAAAALDAGAKHLVHMHNAMPDMTHRAPGVIGAAAERPEVEAEMICDGVHVHPSVIRASFSMFGRDRLILISDTMRAAGMKDGQYKLGDLDVNVNGKYATMVRDGALAGSVTLLPDCVRTTVIDMNIPLEDAIACATINPARSLGIQDTHGLIQVGRAADLVLWDSNLKTQLVLKKGKKVN